MTNTGLEELLKRQQVRRNKQMGIAILAGTAILALVVFLAPKPQAAPLVEEEATPVAEAPDAYADVALIGKAAIVYDLATGEVLFARNADTQLPLASITKLLTMYAASSALDDSTPITITESALAADGESGFMLGESFAFSELAQLALVSSSNDATQAIAEATAAKRSLSSQNMLASAASAAGLTKTYAINGTGLDESLSVSGGYGSAKDVAILAGALLKQAPEIAKASVEPRMTIYSNTGVPHTLPNTNPDVITLPGILLSKTGFTDLAGGNLVVVYDAAIGHPVAIVVLGSTRDGRFTDVEDLLDRTLAHFAGVSS